MDAALEPTTRGRERLVRGRTWRRALLSECDESVSHARVLPSRKLKEGNSNQREAMDGGAHTRWKLPKK